MARCAGHARETAIWRQHGRITRLRAARPADAVGKLARLWPLADVGVFRRQQREIRGETVTER
jgi:hypothetical protein